MRGLEDIPIAKTNVNNTDKLAEKEALHMTVSPVCTKGEEKYAFVTFSDQENPWAGTGDSPSNRVAEGRIPEGKIIRNTGFSGEEVQQLEDYMKKELTRLKKMAAGVNVLRAFMK